MKKSLIAIASLLTTSMGFAAADALVPMPLKVAPKGEVFQLNKKSSVILSHDSLMNEGNVVANLLNEQAAILPKIAIAEKAGANTISLSINPAIQHVEGYRLEVGKRGIRLEAATRAGLFNGAMTLAQWSYGNVMGQLQGVVIEDEPRLSYRALMLDPARSFVKVDEVKRYIDEMARYKFNVLHLHLSDDQGWRVEIKKYPKLTEIGSKRKETEGNRKPHEGFYTQEDLKEIVRYATERHVDVVPEIDVPGHSVAAIAAYPELTCFSDKKIEVRTIAGVSKDLLCCGNPKVFEFYGDIIDELSSIFTSPRFHMGGDEAPLDHWTECPKCQALKKAKGFETEQQLMSYFFAQINKSLERNKKYPLMWYELDVPDYPKKSILFAWRMGLSPAVIKKAREMGHQVICAPGEHAYFDYPQRKGDMPEVNWGMPILSLEQVYKFDPGYGLPVADQSHIIGVEATLWGECIPDVHRAFYMTYPRALALAEAGWSTMENRNWDCFKKRMIPNLKQMLDRGINFRMPYEVLESKGISTEKTEILSNKVVAASSNHLAFPDLIRYKGEWLATFRESDAHVMRQFSRAVVMRSKDFVKWERVFELEIPGWDVRDPRFSYDEKRDSLYLHLHSASMEGNYGSVRRNFFVAFDKQLNNFTTTTRYLRLPEGDERDWLWRPYWYKGELLVSGYRIPGGERLYTYHSLNEFPKREVVMDTDGTAESRVDETTIRVYGDKRYYLMRGVRSRLGVQSVAGGTIAWKDLEISDLGGPNFLKIGEKLYFGGRTHDRYTSLFKYDLQKDDYEKVCDLPATGDCSYPAFVSYENKIYGLYYTQSITDPAKREIRSFIWDYQR